MGFTQLWLNPVLQNNQPRGSYHGYATTDFYRIDARLGNNALYRRWRGRPRKGIGVIMDVILNHCGSAHWWMKDLPDPDWINHDGTSSPLPIGVRPCRTRISRGRMRAFTDGWFVPTMPDLNQRHPQLATYLIAERDLVDRVRGPLGVARRHAALCRP